VETRLEIRQIFEITGRGGVLAGRILEGGPARDAHPATRARFQSQRDGTVLAIWSLELNRYEVYLETGGRKVTAETEDGGFFEQVIRAFFGGERSDLLERLSRTSGAVTVSGGVSGRLKRSLGLR